MAKLKHLKLPNGNTYDFHAIDADQVNGHTVASDVPSNADFTNTWRPVQDNLTSTSTSDSLSANQGKILNDTKLEKTTYEWNKEVSFGSSGYLKIGSFAMYDSNVTIEINSTANTTYHGTLVIATQNVTSSSIGSVHVVKVYDDPTGVIAESLRIVWTNGSRNYDIYFVPSNWSKNLIHIQALGLYGYSDICTAQAGTPPTTTTGLEPINVLASKSAASGGTDLSLVTTGEKYTWNSNASSDEKVKQTPTSTDADYEILFSESASNLTKTEGARKYSNLKFNPSTGNLQTTKINGIPLTSSPKFTDSKTQLTEDTGSWNTRTPYHMNTDAYSICMDSSSIDSGTPQSGVRGCDYSRRIAIHPNSSAISIGCCDGRYSRYLYDAIGFASVAISGGDDEESQYTTSGASGTASISVGTACHANANNTVAIGDHINANGKYEFSFGRYNVSGRSSLPIVDGEYDYDAEGTYVETVGNGTSSTRSNARTLDWSGNEWLAGTLTASGATINGSISVSDNILSDDSSLDITTSAPSSDYWSQYGIYFRDTNQTEFGRVRGYYLTDGEVGVEYETKRTVGGTVKYNNLNLGIDSSGNNVVSVSSPSAWRTALGLKDWAEVDHKGGTTPIAIPSGTTEICCVITVGNNTIAWTFTLPYAALSSTSWRYTNAYTSVSDGYIAVNVSTAQVSLNAVYNGKSNVTNSSILYLYAR